MIKADLGLFMLKRKYRKKRLNESYCFDQVCPKCDRFEMICLWSTEKNKYISKRCSSTKCDYGNTNE